MIAVVKSCFIHNEVSYEQCSFPRAFGCRIFKSLLTLVASYLIYKYAIAVVMDYFAERVMRYRKEEGWYGEMPATGLRAGLVYVG